MLQGTSKLNYDVPASVKQMLIEDAAKLNISATKLVTQLIKDNHNKGVK